jgi:probable rRNA maturation factor
MTDLVEFLKAELGIAKATTVDVIFVNEDVMAELHMRYMGLPGPTDVISFPAIDVAKGPVDPRGWQDEPTFGDIVICSDFIERTTGDALGGENIGTYVIHGFLHLLGYDHQTATDAKVMFEKQEALMLSWQKSKYCKP